ncbi:hypothetical protein Tco_1332296, partial [Tanacetum coccineum]
MRIKFNKPQRESTYQVTLDVLKLSPCYPAFLITAEVLEIYMHQFWNTIKKIKDTDAYRFKLDKQKFRINTEVFCEILQICPRLPNQDFVEPPSKEEMVPFIKELSLGEHLFQSSIRASLGSQQVLIASGHQELKSCRIKPSLRGTRSIFTQFKDYQKYGALIPEEIINQAIKDSKEYKIYLAYATRAATPKKAMKFTKPASPSKKQTLVLEDEPAKKPKQAKHPELAKKSAFAKKDVSSKKPSRKKSTGGSSKGADSKSEVPDEPKGDSGDEADEQSDDDHEQADDERIKSNDEDKETHDDEFVHTPNDYVPTDDETNNESDDVTEEEYERINEELYGDVNVSFTNAEPADKEKDDEEMTVVGYVKVNQEGAANQVKDDAHATQKIEDRILKLTPILTPTTEATTSTTVIPDSKTLSAFHQRITNLEKDVKELKTIDHSAALLSTIKSEVPNVVKEYLGTSLDDALYKVLKKHDADIIKEHSVLAKIQVPKETITSSDTTTLEEFDQKTTLFETMTKSKSFNKSPKQRALYHALMESILEDADAMDKGVTNKLKKRKQDDADKDEGPFAGSDRGLKK